MAAAFLLAGCGSDGNLSDAAAVSASGAKNCVVDPGKILVRAEYKCDGGLILDTFTGPAPMAMAKGLADSIGKSLGITTVTVKQGENWRLAKITSS